MDEGLLAEFESPEALLEGARRIAQMGLTHVDAFTPYPVPDLDRVLSIRRSRIPRWVLAGGVLGCSFAYFFQWWISVVDYPLNVGGRPLHSAPAFIPITFETTVLFASLTAFGAWLVYSGLPAPWHPVFEVAGFERASVDRFWLGIDARDPRFLERLLREQLREAGAMRVERTARCP
jgi:hypothetical protein